MVSRAYSLYLKAKHSPQNMTFTDLCTLAESDEVGFIFRRQKGTSHRIYKHPSLKHPQYGNMMNFQKGKGKQAKEYQVQQLVNFIDYFRLITE